MEKKRGKNRKNNYKGFLNCFLMIKTSGMLNRNMLILVSLACHKSGFFWLLMDLYESLKDALSELE